MNLTTMLCIGSGTDYSLPVRVIVSDTLGSESYLNMTIHVIPPSMTSAPGVVDTQNGLIDEYISSGDMEAAALALQASGSVLQYIFDDSSEESTEAISLRSEYLRLVQQYVQEVDSSSMVESSLVAIETASSSGMSSLSYANQSNILDMIVSVSTVSANLGSITSTASELAVESASDIITAGILSNKEKSSTLDTSISKKKMSHALSQISTAITADLVAGEDATNIATESIGLTSQVISSNFLHETDSGVVVSVALPTSSSEGIITPTFTLPPNLLLLNGTDLSNEESVSVSGTSWASNPYALIGSALDNGSIVTGLSLVGLNITGLSDPIIIKLPLAVEGNATNFNRRLLVSLFYRCESFILGR